MHAPFQRTSRRRALRACSRCRVRKVRCDATEKGAPCNNCYLDGLKCLVPDNPRNHKAKPDGISRVSHLDKKRGAFSIPSDTQSVSESTGSPDDCRDFISLEFTLSRSGNRQLSGPGDLDFMSLNRPLISSISGPLTPSSKRASCSPPPVLPRFIHPLPSHLDSDAIEYLQKKGAFDLPDISLRNELLRCYVQYFHPYLPLIDISEFLTIIAGNSPKSTTSLLLYSAVMFAATAYVDMEYLRRHGYSQRGSARRVFFERVKVLCDMDFELDRLTLIQSVLLMTCWYDSPNAPKDVWHWLNVAIFHARTIGLTPNPSNVPFLTSAKKRLWKRIWWSYYMRVRLVGLALRQVAPINDSDVDVPMLEPADFDPGSIPTEVMSMLGHLPTIQDVSVRQPLAILCIALAKLCVLIGQILKIQYSIPSYQLRTDAGGEQATSKVPWTAIVDPSAVVRCDCDLNCWYAEYSSELLATNKSPNSFDSAETDVILSHRAILTGLYLSAVSVLHRPQIPHSDPEYPSIPELKSMSWRRIHETAEHITNLYQHLHNRNLLALLPNISVVSLVPATILYLLYVKNGDLDAQATGRAKLSICMQVLKELEMYPPASLLCKNVETALSEIDMTQSIRNPSVISHEPNQSPAKEFSVQREGLEAASLTGQLTKDAGQTSDTQHDQYFSQGFTNSATQNNMYNFNLEPGLHPTVPYSSLSHASGNITHGDSATRAIFESDHDAQMTLKSLLSLEGCGSFLTLASELDLDLDFEFDACGPLLH